MTARAHTSTGPLAGVRVLDVSIMAAGPWTGALLGMLAALLKKADVPITDRTDAELRALGLKQLARDAARDYPRLIHVHVSPWGRREQSTGARLAEAGFTTAAAKRMLAAAGKDEG
ncbi:MAG: hypothetical protein HYY78_04835 [Betaproteobacteria bacterium]|nr:hypothetical protein [Betaproteobacteria bacterium]